MSVNTDVDELAEIDEMIALIDAETREVNILLDRCGVQDDEVSNDVHQENEYVVLSDITDRIAEVKEQNAWIIAKLKDRNDNNDSWIDSKVRCEKMDMLERKKLWSIPEAAFMYGVNEKYMRAFADERYRKKDPCIVRNGTYNMICPRLLDAAIDRGEVSFGTC